MTAAAWITASQPSSATGDGRLVEHVALAHLGRLGGHTERAKGPGGAGPITDQKARPVPRAMSDFTAFDPMKPDAPVTSTRMISN